MKRVGLWWVPLLLIVAPLVGLTPAHRDILDFFAPMRATTADMLIGGIVPWLNLANGCGEAWFANPQTGVLYPPVWFHAILPTSWAMATEVALHLAWLSLGTGLLAHGLGARGWGRSMTELAAWAAGPVLTTVGVLNNLETLAWVPWMILAARAQNRRTIPLLAVATAMAWLGGEPQILAVGALVVLGVARRRGEAVAGIALGLAVVAVQLIPFIYWIVEGDRGAAAASWALRGALAPADWVGVVAPGLGGGAERMVYAESLFLGAPVLLCALLGVWRHRWILAVVAFLGLLATLPEIGGGGLFLGLTGGFVRYPSRFALLGIALLLPFIGPGAEDWLEGRGRWLAMIVATITVVVCIVGSHPWRWWVAGGPAVLLLLASLLPVVRWFRGVVLVAGFAGMVVAGVPLIDLQPIEKTKPVAPTWPEARDGGRIYAPAPAQDIMPWLSSGIGPRRLWPIGYLNLSDDLILVRTYSPVSNGALASHLAITDEGPAQRWWLDALAARWMILPVGDDLPHRMEEVRQQGGMRLLRNLDAVPVASLAADPPQANAPWRGVGAVTSVEVGPNRLTFATSASSSGWAWISLAPVRGWRWHLDGNEVGLDPGPGIMQSLRITEGRHRLEGWYRPPALVPAAVVSIITVALLLISLAAGSRYPVRRRV
jgi:hypothetical protein